MEGSAGRCRLTKPSPTSSVSISFPHIWTLSHIQSSSVDRLYSCPLTREALLPYPAPPHLFPSLVTTFYAFPLSCLARSRLGFVHTFGYSITTYIPVLG